MFHYVGNFKHWTAETKNGTFRSPCREMAHLVGTEIFDKKLKRNYQPRLLMDMEVPFKKILNRFPCKYTDEEIPLETRVSELVCDIYDLNQKDSERVYASFFICLPNYLAKEQNAALSEEYGRFFSEKWKRPVLVSYHRIFGKDSGENGNNIVYIVSPYRELLEDGNWTQKSYSYFLDKNGNLILDKKYKDENGNDIRKPRVPKNEKPIYKKDKNGHMVCINQLRRKDGRLDWFRTRSSDMFCFKHHQVKELNDEIDEVMNEFFRKNGIDDKVERLRSDIRQKLKECGLRVKRYHGLFGEEKLEVLENNARYRMFANVLLDIENKKEKQEKELARLDEEQKDISAKIKKLEDKKSEIEKEIAGIDKDIEEALSNMTEEERKEFDERVAKLEEELKKKYPNSDLSLL